MNMPPKNMISVIRNTHMPMEEASRCCSMSSKWCRSSWVARAWLLSDNGDLLGKLVVVVRFPGHYRGFVKIVSRRRRCRLPLQPGGAPGIVARLFAVAQRPQEVHHGQQISHCQHRGSRRREHVQHLEFRRVSMIAPRHSRPSQNELREKREVESDEDGQRRQPPPHLRVHPARYLGPPEMHA